jgi:hypothetical protein
MKVSKYVFLIPLAFAWLLGMGFLISENLNSSLELFPSEEKRLGERRRVMSTLDNLQPGMTYDACLRVVVRQGWPSSQVHLYSDQIAVETLFELSAQNWQFLLTFDEEKLARIQVGTLDNLNRPPHDFPLQDWKAEPTD